MRIVTKIIFLGSELGDERLHIFGGGKDDGSYETLWASPLLRANYDAISYLGVATVILMPNSLREETELKLRGEFAPWQNLAKILVRYCYVRVWRESAHKGIGTKNIGCRNQAEWA